MSEHAPSEQSDSYANPGPLEGHLPPGSTVVIGHAHEGVYIGVDNPEGCTAGLFVGADQARDLARRLEFEAKAWEE